MLNTNPDNILLQRTSIPKTQSESIKQSFPQHTSTATWWFPESRAIFQSVKTLALNPLQKPHYSTRHQGSLFQIPLQRNVQKSTHSIKQPSPFYNPASTKVIIRRMTTMENSTKLTSWYISSSSVSRNTFVLSNVLTHTSWNSIEQSSTPNPPTTTTRFVESAAFLKQSMTMLTNQEPIPTSNVPQRNNKMQTSSHSIEHSSPLKSPATKTSVSEGGAILKSSITRISNHNSILTNPLPQRDNTTQKSPHLIEQSLPVNSPTTTTTTTTTTATTTRFFESAAILKSSMTKITKQEPRLSSKLPQRNNIAHSVEQPSSLNSPISITSTLPRKNSTTLMKIQPTRTTQRPSETSHPSNSTGNVILVSVCYSLSALCDTCSSYRR